MVQSHWGGGNIHKWYRHTSGGIVGHITPIFCLHAFVMILKCGTVVVAVTSNLHSRWCQQLFHEKKKCNYWQYNFVLTQNSTSLLFRPLLCNVLQMGHGHELKKRHQLNSLAKIHIGFLMLTSVAERGYISLKLNICLWSGSAHRGLHEPSLLSY